MPHLSWGNDESTLLRRAAVTVLSASLILGVVVTRRFTRIEVDGESMSPTLCAGDRLLVWRTQQVRPGELVVVHDPRDGESLWVKRVRDVTDDGVDVRGDDPDRSTDSRHVGPIPRRLVVGRVVRRYAEG